MAGSACRVRLASGRGRNSPRPAQPVWRPPLSPAWLPNWPGALPGVLSGSVQPAVKDSITSRNFPACTLHTCRVVRRNDGRRGAVDITAWHGELPSPRCRPAVRPFPMSAALIRSCCAAKFHGEPTDVSSVGGAARTATGTPAGGARLTVLSRLIPSNGFCPFRASKCCRVHSALYIPLLHSRANSGTLLAQLVVMVLRPKSDAISSDFWCRAAAAWDH